MLETPTRVFQANATAGSQTEGLPRHNVAATNSLSATDGSLCGKRIRQELGLSRIYSGVAQMGEKTGPESIEKREGADAQVHDL
jgi:hypothetical protein